MAWWQGKYNCTAYTVALNNALAKNESDCIDFPQWQDYFEKAKTKKQAEERTAEDVEFEFRQQQIDSNAWLRRMKEKRG